MKSKIQIGDLVQVTSGKHRYRPGSINEAKQAPAQGRVLKVDVKRGVVVVEGVNKGAFHERRRQAEKTGEVLGGRVERERPIAIGNVMLVDPQTKKPVRVGFREENGKKVRFTKGRNASGVTLQEE